jgi:hypothetical protein
VANPRGPALLKVWRGRRKKAVVARLIGAARQAYQRWEDGAATPDPLTWFHLDVVTGGAVPWDSWSLDEAMLAEVRAAVGRQGQEANDDGSTGRTA